MTLRGNSPKQGFMFFKSPQGHDYHRFSGWRLVALILVYVAYVVWYTGVGPFGQLTRIEGYDYLQGRGFYTGAEAVAAIEMLSPESRRLKYIALGLDVIYMFLQTWLFEALIAFGLSALGVFTSRWRWLLLLPMGFLLFDILEDSALALLLATSSELIGSFAGVFTALKYAIFLPLIPISVGLAIAGSVASILRNRKPADSRD